MKNGINVENFSCVRCGNIFMWYNKKLSLHSTDDLSGETQQLRRFILPR